MYRKKHNVYRVWYYLSAISGSHWESLSVSPADKGDYYICTIYVHILCVCVCVCVCVCGCGCITLGLSIHPMIDT